MGLDSYSVTCDFLLALTPVERWSAAGRQFQSNGFMTERWFIAAVAVVLIILTVLLVAVHRQKRTRRQKGATQLFFECAERRGLSARECHVLLEVAKKAGIGRSEDIFADDVAFYRGASRLMEEGIARGRTGTESDLLSSELFFLREKLAFRRQTQLFSGPSAKSARLSSRQIPVGRKVNITCRAAKDSDDIEAVVLENDHKELTLKVAASIKVTFGELWRVRYCFGASIWEFDTTIAGCNADILVLNHSDTIRFINRRRFLRVPVREPAFVARFPFSRMLFAQGRNDKADSAPRSFDGAWAAPEFIPAVVTELAGPGLRIEAPLDVKAGDRLLVVMKLGEDDEQQPATVHRYGNGRSAALRVVEDIGQVRHVRPLQNTFSIAVELVGLSDADINELIRATNNASRKPAPESQVVPDSANTRKEAPEPVTV